MKRTPNYYQILHVQPDAPGPIIRSSYRTLMQKLDAHPDRGGDTSKAALINTAYAVLSDPEKRARYDRELQAGGDSATPTHKGRTGGSAHETRTGACLFCGCAYAAGTEKSRDSFCTRCGSPLCLVEHVRDEHSDQRKIARIGNNAPLSFMSHWQQKEAFPGTTDNISKLGMMFRTGHRVAADSIVSLNCMQLLSTAVVLSCRQDGNILRPSWRVRVKFLTLHFKSSCGVFVSDTA